MNRSFPALVALTMLAAACATSRVPPPPTLSKLVLAPGATRVLDAAAAERLRANSGVTLQWIGWNDRGTATVGQNGGVWRLRAAQAQPNGPGRLFLDGTVTEIGTDYFLFDGVVRISDSPDVGRRCEKRDTWRFAITQNRPYWRIRQFEWCDGLTDYIDIYF